MIKILDLSDDSLWPYQSSYRGNPLVYIPSLRSQGHASCPRSNIQSHNVEATAADLHTY